MTMHARYLRHLAASDADRAELVEALRAASALLTGTGLEGQLTEPTRTAVAHRIARELREAACQLCDHSRLHGVVCRYCEGVVPGGSYDADTLGTWTDPRAR